MLMPLEVGMRIWSGDNIWIPGRKKGKNCGHCKNIFWVNKEKEARSLGTDRLVNIGK